MISTSHQLVTIRMSDPIFDAMRFVSETENDTRYIVALGTFIGYATPQLIGALSIETSTAIPTGYVDTVVVIDDVQRQGCGRLLYEAACELEGWRIPVRNHMTVAGSKFVKGIGAPRVGEFQRLTNDRMLFVGGLFLSRVIDRLSRQMMQERKATA